MALTPGILANSSVFIKSGSGNVTISNGVVGGGSTSITGGTLTAGADQAISSGALSLSTGTTLDFGGHNAGVSSISLTGATISGVGTLTPVGAITAALDPSTSTISGGTIALSTTAHSFTVADGASTSDLTINSLLTGSTGTLTKSGTGTMTLNGNNTGLTDTWSVGAGTIANRKQQCPRHRAD